MANYLKAFLNWLYVLSKKERTNDTQEFDFPVGVELCHKDKVHIFVRGLADSKLHVARNRHYSDFRFYKKQGLKVFCAVCRKRVL